MTKPELEKELKTLQGKYDALLNQSTQQTETIGDLRGKLSNKEQDYETLEGRYEALLNQSTQQAETIGDLQGKLSNKETELAQLIQNKDQEITALRVVNTTADTPVEKTGSSSDRKKPKSLPEDKRSFDVAGEAYLFADVSAFFFQGTKNDISAILKKDMQEALVKAKHPLLKQQ